MKLFVDTGAFIALTDAVGDTEGGPKGNIVGQAGAGIGTDHCLGFPS